MVGTHDSPAAKGAERPDRGLQNFEWHDANRPGLILGGQTSEEWIAIGKATGEKREKTEAELLLIQGGPGMESASGRCEDSTVTDQLQKPA